MGFGLDGSLNREKAAPAATFESRVAGSDVERDRRRPRRQDGPYSFRQYRPVQSISMIFEAIACVAR